MFGASKVRCDLPILGASRETVQSIEVAIQRFDEGEILQLSDRVALEEPLEIRLEWLENGARNHRSVSITMRTPGSDAELAVGFLVGEGVLRSRGDLLQVVPCGPDSGLHRGTNVVRVCLADHAVVTWPALERHFYATSSCGVCGKASLEALQVAGVAPIARTSMRISPQEVCELPAKLRSRQGVFDQTGGLHAAALFALDALGAATVVAIREDVGRHNAVDKVVGSQFMAGQCPLADRILVLSGRASFELVQKAAVAGIPIIVAVGAPSSLAIELAQKFNITLLGFVRGNRFNIYHGGWRVDSTT